MLMDSVFKVVSGMSDTGAQHGVLVQNLTRYQSLYWDQYLTWYQLLYWVQKLT
ncbi:hypothetical protein DPMN_013268 [Dreissena polymorpha]|uniref:Uncharacterized protein n=1 Tax=Dreissena polymorpha TaxID=45954 RepID=A0A9D4S466_DREPO|nr:hypothetical protein DPMN_013268 [Dreissena polymorpha]